MPHVSRRGFLALTAGSTSLLSLPKAVLADTEEGEAVSDAPGSPSTDLSEDASEDLLYRMEHDLPESFRYSSDNSDCGDAASSSSSNSISSSLRLRSVSSGDAWSETDGGYLSSNGSLIPHAVAKGIDVSEHQGKIDWDSVKDAGIDFAILRCSYGWPDDVTSAKQHDKEFARNASECERVGIPYGIYHYSYAIGVTSAEQEARYLLASMGDASPSLPIYYDLEDVTLPYGDASLLGDMATRFCEAVKAAGYTPGVYANLNWWNNYLTDPRFENWSRWVAQYNYRCDYTGGYRYWQCTSSGKVSGVPENVDIDFLLRRDSVTVHRLYNPYSGEHLYTLDSDEKDNLTAVGWRYEGTGWYAPTSGDSVLRLYNPYNGEHLYIVDESEYESLQEIGWKGEGLAWHTSVPTSGEPLFRKFNPYETVGTHNYTLSASERDSLVPLGWRDEGVAWYGA